MTEDQFHENNCVTCKFFYTPHPTVKNDNNLINGYCIRYAPLRNKVDMWPKVFSNQWCGEHTYLGVKHD